MTRDEVVEVMARAIFEAEGRAKDVRWEDADKVLAIMPARWGDRPPSVTAHYREVAATALTALEAAGLEVVPVEPSESMKQAGGDVEGHPHDDYSGGDPVCSDVAEAVWLAMLAAYKQERG